MLSRLRRRGPSPDPKSVNFTREHVTLAKTIARRRKVLGLVNRYLPRIR